MRPHPSPWLRPSLWLPGPLIALAVLGGARSGAVWAESEREAARAEVAAERPADGAPSTPEEAPAAPEGDGEHPIGAPSPRPAALGGPALPGGGVETALRTVDASDSGAPAPRIAPPPRSPSPAGRLALSRAARPHPRPHRGPSLPRGPPAPAA